VEAYEESEKAEADLNDVLSSLKSSLRDWPTERVRALEASQAAFETYCLAQMDLVHGLNEAGSIGPMRRWKEKTCLIRERTKHLKDFQDGLASH
jgi:uncharacterized protein YecT (DUF1311 family)